MVRRRWYIKITFCITILLYQLNLAGQHQDSIPLGGELRINLIGIKNNRGVVLISLFGSPEGYPSDPTKALLKLRIPLNQLQLPVIIKSLKPGSYAVALLHDEDENGKMLTSILGLPKEGYGFSNNVIGLSGPPSFQKASFSVSSTGTTITLRVRY
jgi:uncharacterized protein (DUF2141 family)